MLVELLPQHTNEALHQQRQTKLYHAIRGAHARFSLEEMLRARWSARWAGRLSDEGPLGSVVRRACTCIRH
eukprot:11225595-Lingulodinium_polyedra.AAC.1